MNIWNASVDVWGAGIKASRRRCFLPSFNTRFLGVLPEYWEVVDMSAAAGRSLKDRYSFAMCVLERPRL